jgi:uncharacterized protein
MSEITDNTARHRFEMVVDGQTAYVTYALRGDHITLIHTEVPTALGGRGIGSKLARAVLDEVRRRGLRLSVECEFLERFIRRNPDYADLLAS